MAIKKFEKVVIGKVEHQQSEVGAIYPIGIIHTSFVCNVHENHLGLLLQQEF